MILNLPWAGEDKESVRREVCEASIRAYDLRGLRHENVYI